MARFHKMHGLGNDFVVIDLREGMVGMMAAQARAIADRHTGIGCDQLILLDHAANADVAMRIFNADGSEAEACGNATRCVALLLGKPGRIETLAGILEVSPANAMAQVVMGEPAFDWARIPLAMPMDTLDMPVGWDSLDRPSAVNVGNPHVVFFVDDVEAVPLNDLGLRIEHDPLFPERVNVNVAQILAKDHIRLRVWERGVGETRACGTGACATAVAALRRKLVTSPVTVSLPGGDLTIAWQPGEPMLMTGPATHVFTGEADWSQFG
ncbi:MAG: diaminopimelate epimerase [Alphaproteobacteria bacterium]|nr:diaminopimelate epimerase [Alphaproteobacteria bacterium]MDE2042809.1 diaminopimelate epimerase [Alphaproteobacteria bacterium]MDE2339677.1 diaminopimelate epimerase [Alphaproteobacteria bacterium]